MHERYSSEYSWAADALRKMGLIAGAGADLICPSILVTDCRSTSSLVRSWVLRELQLHQRRVLRMPEPHCLTNLMRQPQRRWILNHRERKSKECHREKCGVVSGHTAWLGGG